MALLADGPASFVLGATLSVWGCAPLLLWALHAGDRLPLRFRAVSVSFPRYTVSVSYTHLTLPTICSV
eukprot:12181305-Alexandrium_andersonii.AAC.1